MKIRIGNIFESHAQTLVNTVNCVGVMGKGIALEFKKRYPEMFNDYKIRCEEGKLKPGIPYLYEDTRGTSILNFPTKQHWRSPSKYSYIEEGLDFFREHYKEWNIKSIAFPPLGCGNGGLEWSDVGPLMYTKLADLDIDTEIYAPYGTDPGMITEQYLKGHVTEAAEDISGKNISKINKYWFLILYVIEKLNQDKYSLNVGRTIYQKICYILTRNGIPTGFHFREGTYGPYSPEVKRSIQALSNANFMSERQLGKMVETVVNPDFHLDKQMFTQDEMKRTENTIDLLSRIKNTDQAEMISTILFAFDKLSEENDGVTERAIVDHIHQWKKWWGNTRDREMINTIGDLALMGYIRPERGTDKLMEEEDLF